MGSWPDHTLKALHHPSLKNRAVIITGGGRGFGWLIAEELLRAGAKVTLTASRHPEELAAVKAKAEQIGGPGCCLIVRADVSQWEDCLATVDATLQAFGNFDVLINNAGRGSAEFRTEQPPDRKLFFGAKFYDITPAAFRTVIETNLIGVFYMTKAVMQQHFLKRGFGKICSMSTSLNTMSAPGLSPYGASKAGLEMMHRVWAQELKGSGIDLNVLLPGGAADTEFNNSAVIPGKVGERAKEGSSLLPGDVIVPPAVWLSTDATNGMTGQRIIAKFWDKDASPAEAMKACVQPHNDVPGIM